MGILTDLLLLPVTAPINGTIWIAEKLLEQAEGEIYDEGKVRGQLMEMELKLDLGEITEDEYMEAEEYLLERIKEIREYNASKAQQ
ncbi:gas vesicle protein GvpG [Candidatus Chloroploca asiatica]|uniref:Gas vesicle protein GvpG n=1 Tax=Candidatus Chloroploca asiatica TaxID=1506545 RepID=A0A2H3KRC8_9CHLR|nr:gas vesicle protein GvpG [Candidatus Chloroploca asiatica]PDW01091.1 hypothetical protein A9Q02_08015 [Candidatus Chloroploca asiatica]